MGAFGRVYIWAHHVFDVLSGIAIGYIISIFGMFLIKFVNFNPIFYIAI